MTSRPRLLWHALRMLAIEEMRKASLITHVWKTCRDRRVRGTLLGDTRWGRTMDLLDPSTARTIRVVRVLSS